jgi:hypothetical protein
MGLEEKAKYVFGHLKDAQFRHLDEGHRKLT